MPQYRQKSSEEHPMDYMAMFGSIKRVTEKAYEVDFSAGGGFHTWVPKSVLKYPVPEIGNNQVFVLPGWFTRQNM